MSKLFGDIKQETNDAFRATASTDPVVRAKAVTQFLDAIELPIRQGVMDGENTAGIFNVTQIPAGTTPEFPMDFVEPGAEGQFVAWTNPGKGYIPAIAISGNKIVGQVVGSTFAVEYDLEYARNARWDILRRLTEVFMASFVKKRNDDGWHTLLAAAANRGMVVYDPAASAGVFTKKLFSLLRCSMARNGGGNQTSLKKARATDVYISCEGVEEILNWDLSQVPDAVRTQLYAMSNGTDTVVDILKTRVHEMYELGVGQEYQTYYTDKLGGSLETSDTELGIALDLMNRDSFIFAFTQPLEVYEDANLHRSQMGGWYGWERYSVLALDNRRILPLSF